VAPVAPVTPAQSVTPADAGGGSSGAGTTHHSSHHHSGSGSGTITIG
jgi:hypothetical protein